MLFLAPTLSWADDVVARPTDDLDAIIADTPDSILAPWAHTIWLVPGDYVGAFVVDDEVLTLRAVVPGTVFLRAAPGQTEPVVRVQGGSHLALEGVVVSPGPYSIGVDVEASAALTLLRMAFYTTEASPTLLSTASTRDLQIAGSRFIGGSATTEGGHILHTGSGTLMLERVHFEGGSATSGGCIRSTGGPISVDRTLFDGCTAAVDGGAIHKDAGGRVDIVRSAFRDSTAGGWGGALYVHVDADISLSTVCQNTAGHAGGGLDWYGPLANALTITNTAFLDNQALTANDWGAAIRAATDRNVAIAVRSSSFARNSGSDVGTFYSSANPPGSVTLEGLEVETSTTTLYDLASQASTPVTFTTSNFWPDPYVGSPFWPGGTSITNDPRAYATAQGTCDLGSVDVGTGAFGTGGLEDSDGDGYYVPFDCDDTSSAVHPGVLQDVGCDGRDDDCDGLVDEDSNGSPLFLDADGDGLGDDTWILDICTAEGPLLVDVAGDCDDTDADVLGVRPFYVDADGDGLTVGPVMACDPPTGAAPQSPEPDCDDTTDLIGGPTPWYTDADADGFGVNPPAEFACAPPQGLVAMGGDCDDAAPGIRPGADDSACNGVDDNCDGIIDEGGPLVLFADDDGDHFGGEAAGTGCLALGVVEEGGDCDDADASIHPGAPETECNGTDNDCDGLLDEDAEGPGGLYADLDGDGYGAGAELMGCDPEGVPRTGDCDDGDALVNPAAPDRDCDGVDDDCDGTVDEGAPVWVDLDGDGAWTVVGEPCGAAPGPRDCDDGDSIVFPGATETCEDERDLDCDGLPGSRAPTCQDVEVTLPGEVGCGCSGAGAGPSGWLWLLTRRSGPATPPG